MTNILSQTTKSIGRTLSRTVAAGEELVIGKPARRCNTSDAAGGTFLEKGSRKVVKRTVGLARSATGNGKGRRTRSLSPKKAKSFDSTPQSQRIFCSNMYTSDFVTNALEAVEKDRNVCSIELEDLIQRKDSNITKVVIDMLVNNALADRTMRRQPGVSNSTKRVWSEIVFVDCVSDAESYKEYLTLKLAFERTMKQRLALKGVREDLPIRFQAKIELHTMLDVMEVIHLLQAVERDETVTQVRFGVRGRGKDIPPKFASMADPETMGWTQTTQIDLFYGKRAKDLHEENNPATALVRECIEALEGVVFGMGFDASEKLELNSNSCKERRGDELRVSTGTEMSFSGSESSLRVTMLQDE